MWRDDLIGFGIAMLLFFSAAAVVPEHPWLILVGMAVFWAWARSQPR